MCGLCGCVGLQDTVVGVVKEEEGRWRVQAGTSQEETRAIEAERGRRRCDYNRVGWR